MGLPPVVVQLGLAPAFMGNVKFIHGALSSAIPGGISDGDSLGKTFSRAVGQVLR